MKTFNMSVNCIPVEVIGFGGENDVTEVICDFGAWAEEFGQGAISLAVRRPVDIDPYLAALTVDGTAAHWMITDVETSYKGVGEAQWIYTVGEQVKKSAVFGFRVERSLNSDTVELPEAYQTWFDDLVALDADIHEVAEKVYEATGHYPKIENGYWYVWNVSTESWTNTGQKAQGEEGAPGVGIASTVLNADYTLTITLTDGTSYTTPSIRGATGNGIASTVLNSDYTLTITFTDGTSYTTPSIRGAQGVPGQDYVITSADYDEIAGRVDTMIAGERQAALDDIDEAKTDAVSDVTAEGTTQKGLVTAEGTTQKGLVTSEGTTQVGLVTTKGQEVLESIPEDYSELSDDVSELKADFAHKEDWIVGNAEQLLSDKYTEDSEPYIFRKSVSGDREFDEIVGGTIAWNQFYNTSRLTSAYTNNGITFTRNESGRIVINGTSSGGSTLPLSGNPIISGHVYFVRNLKSNGLSMYSVYDLDYETIRKAVGNNDYLSVTVKDGVSLTNYLCTGMAIDLTQMFGSAVADYIYSLETATSGAGVALFRSLFPKPYYAYNPGELKSITGLVSHDTVGFNQWDEEWEEGSLNSTGNLRPASNSIRSKSYSPCVGGETYYVTCGKTDGGGQNRYYLAVFFYDADKNFISYAYANNLTAIAPTNARYFKISTNTSTVVYGNTYNHDICVNISDPSKNGTYEPYVKRSYPLDSSLTLRGIPKLDSANKLYYDGDTYESDGTVTRRYGIAVFTGAETWKYFSEYGFYSCSLPLTSDAYWKTSGADENKCSNGIACTLTNNYSVRVYTSDDSLNMNSLFPNGTSLVYLLATPTTETAEPFQSPQICSEYGTEEYVYDSEAFPVPVGHVTQYPDNLRKKLDGLPWDLSMIAPVEIGTKASQAYAVGKYFLLNNQFCKAKTAIASGATFTLNTNYEVTTVADELYTALH